MNSFLSLDFFSPHPTPRVSSPQPPPQLGCPLLFKSQANAPPCSLGKCCKYNRLKHPTDHKQALGDNESLVIRAPLDVTQVHGWSPAAPAPGSASREWPGPQGGVLRLLRGGDGEGPANVGLAPILGRRSGWDEQRPPRPLYAPRQPGSSVERAGRVTAGLTASAPGAQPRGQPGLGAPGTPRPPEPGAAGGHGRSSGPNGPWRHPLPPPG